MEVYLLRHGETEYNAQKRYQGMHDIPLSESGKAMLRRADVTVDTVYVSPLVRARQTASILFPDAKQVVCEPLREMDFGAFEGRSADEMKEDAQYRAWVDGNCEGVTPGGESMAIFAERTCAEFERLMERALEEKRERLVILAHSGTQMAVLGRFAQPQRPYFEWFGPFGGGYVVDASQWAADRVLTLLRTVQYAAKDAEQ